MFAGVWRPLLSSYFKNFPERHRFDRVRWLKQRRKKEEKNIERTLSRSALFNTAPVFTCKSGNKTQIIRH